MKRLHVHVSVDNLDESVRFYSMLFASDPTMRKPDYARWMLDDPCVNFAISRRGGASGIGHLGIQVASDLELAEVYERLRRAERPVLDEGLTTCCYAQSAKRWIDDPQGVRWEIFLTTGASTMYGADDATIATRGTASGNATPGNAVCCGQTMMQTDFSSV